MRQVITLAIVLLVFFANCTNQNVDKGKYFVQGLSLVKQGNPNGALIAFKKAIEEDHSYFEARYQVALIYILRGQNDLAEQELRKVLLLNPSFYDAHLSLARVYVNMGKTADALAELNAFIENKGESPEAFEVEASAYVINKNYRKAYEAVNKSLRISPERVSSKVMLAEICLERGDIDKAEQLIAELEESDFYNKRVEELDRRLRHYRTKK